MSVSFRTSSSWVTLTGFVSTCRTPEARMRRMSSSAVTPVSARTGGVSSWRSLRRASHVGPVAVGQRDVEDDRVDGGLRKDRFGLLEAAGGFRRVALRLEQRGEPVSGGLVVFDHEDARGHRRRSFTPPVGRAGAGVSAPGSGPAWGSSGTVNVTVVPTPSRLWRMRSPPMTSTSCFEIESPRPVPRGASPRAGPDLLEGLERLGDRDRPGCRTRYRAPRRSSSPATAAPPATTRPEAVYLTAFARRLTSTREIFPRSRETLPGQVGVRLDDELEALLARLGLEEVRALPEESRRRRPPGDAGRAGPRRAWRDPGCC